MKVRRLDRRDKGYSKLEWVLDYYESPKRIRKWYKSKGQAEAAMADVKQQRRETGQSWLQLSPEERNGLMSVYAEAKREGIALRTVWEVYKIAKLDVAPIVRRTLAQVIPETIQWRRSENLRERYLGDLENYLRKFASGRTEMLIDKIGVADIEQWFAGRTEALSTRKGNMGRLGSMFDVCFRRGYIKDNPMLRMSSPKLDEKPPERLTSDEAKKLLIAACARRTSLAYFVLGIFAGARPEEISALTWSAVDLDNAVLSIGAEISKVRKHRIMPLHKTAVEWLKPLVGKAGDSISPPAVTLRRHRRTLRKVLGKWPQDVLRHTAASYLIALHKDKAKVALWLGNSERVLEKNYKSPVTEDDCKAFWNLTPEAVEAADGQFPFQAAAP